MLQAKKAVLFGLASCLSLTACGGAEVVDTSSGATVLIAEPQDSGMDALAGGILEIIGGCLGIGDAVVVWPNETEVVDEDPLTIRLGKDRTYQVGDEVSIGGGFIFEHSSDGPPDPFEVAGLEVPEGCAKYDIFLASPF